MSTPHHSPSRLCASLAARGKDLVHDSSDVGATRESVTGAKSWPSSFRNVKFRVSVHDSAHQGYAMEHSIRFCGSTTRLSIQRASEYILSHLVIISLSFPIRLIDLALTLAMLLKACYILISCILFLLPGTALSQHSRSFSPINTDLSRVSFGSHTLWMSLLESKYAIGCITRFRHCSLKLLLQSSSRFELRCRPVI